MGNDVVRPSCWAERKHDIDISTIKPLNPQDFNESEIIECGFNWKATCTICGDQIVAKDKTEYGITT